MRDVTSIGQKMVLILYPAGSASSKALLREWDLWGPLVACLGLAVILSVNGTSSMSFPSRLGCRPSSFAAPPKQSLGVFTGIFVIVWVGSVVVTLNARLLGGKISLLQSVCILGYALFPLTVAALIALFIRLLIVRIIVSAAGWAWSVWGAPLPPRTNPTPAHVHRAAAMNFFGGTKLEDGRAFLAVYPLCLFYAVPAWITMLS